MGFAEARSATGKAACATYAKVWMVFLQEGGINPKKTHAWTDQANVEGKWSRQPCLRGESWSKGYARTDAGDWKSEWKPRHGGKRLSRFL